MKKLLVLLTLVAASTASLLALDPINYYRNSTTTATLDTATAWWNSNGDPVSTTPFEDWVIWNASSATGSDTNMLAGDVQWYGIQILGGVNITASQKDWTSWNVLLGAGGIDTTDAGAEGKINIQHRIILTADQTWYFGASDTIQFNSVDLNGKNLVMDTSFTPDYNDSVSLYNVSSTMPAADGGKALVTVESGRVHIDNTFDGSTARLLLGNCGMDISYGEGQFLNADIEIMAGKRLEIYNRYHHTGNIMTYSGSLSGTGDLNILVTGGSTYYITGNSPNLTGKVELSRFQDNLRFIMLGADASLGSGRLEIHNEAPDNSWRGWTSIEALSGALTLANNEIYYMHLYVGGYYSLTVGGEGHGFYPRDGGSYNTITNAMQPGAELIVAGNLTGHKNGDGHHSTTPFGFLGVGTTHIMGGILDVSGGDRQRSVTIDGGSVIVEGKNTYSSDTTVKNMGRYYVNGGWEPAWNQYAWIEGKVSVDATSTFGGHGTVAMETTIDGTLHATAKLADPAAQLTFTKGLNLTAGSEVLLDPFASIYIATGEKLTIAAGWVFTLGGIAADWQETAGESTLIFTFDPATASTIGNAALLNLFGLNGSLDIDTVNGFVYLNGITTTIPEPTSLVLLGAGILVVTVWRRKKVS